MLLLRCKEPHEATQKNKPPAIYLSLALNRIKKTSAPVYYSIFFVLLCIENPFCLFACCECVMIVKGMDHPGKWRLWTSPLLKCPVPLCFSACASSCDRCLNLSLLHVLSCQTSCRRLLVTKKIYIKSMSMLVG